MKQKMMMYAALLCFLALPLVIVHLSCGGPEEMELASQSYALTSRNEAAYTLQGWCVTSGLMKKGICQIEYYCCEHCDPEWDEQANCEEEEGVCPAGYWWEDQTPTHQVCVCATGWWFFYNNCALDINDWCANHPDCPYDDPDDSYSRSCGGPHNCSGSDGGS